MLTVAVVSVDKIDSVAKPVNEVVDLISVEEPVSIVEVVLVGDVEKVVVSPVEILVAVPFRIYCIRYAV